MTVKLAAWELFVCPHWLRNLSVIATDALSFDGGLKLKNPAGGFVAVRNTQLATGSVAVGVHSSDPDRQLPRNLF
jgi:hypothetical protein